MKHIILATALSGLILSAQSAQAGEFTQSLEQCNTSLEQVYGDARIKFREAKSRGKKAHIIFNAWPEDNAGQTSRETVKCVTTKSDGQVLELSLRDNQSKTWTALNMSDSSIQ